MSAPPSSSGPDAVPLRSALKSEEDTDKTPPASGSLKAVQIAEPPHEAQVEDDAQLRQFTAGLGQRRLSGKFASQYAASSRSSVTDGSPSLRPQEEGPAQTSHHHRLRHGQYYSEKLLAQVSDWLEHERQKAVAAGKRRHHHHRKSKSPPSEEAEGSVNPVPRPTRSDSIDSQSSEISFDRLQRIIEESMASMGLKDVPHFPPKSGRPKHKKSLSRGSLHRTASSDTDYVDGDVIVPSCDSWLDNSKTLSYTGGSVSTDDLAGNSARQERDRDAWLTFKNEIIRAAHTLKLKGWRRVPLDAGDSVDVERLSGALTNAVYVVTPPSELPDSDAKVKPKKILLRIYGPQVEHLIDRENELRVLQRLARKKIGPRLLGTFRNGRFEQYFNAITLTSPDLREPETSRQIAKRMRELHDGIELLYTEREAGPAVWRNWDQWLDNVERITTFLDQQMDANAGTIRRSSVVHAWKANGYVCGLPWPQFRDMVTRYRKYLESFYRDQKDINDRLMFAHNDTQYGNILRLRPDDEKSPLLQPANKHKQLIVIDFEYAGANVPGHEFANHFTEWTYNYHDQARPWACNTERYPSPDQQRRFLKAYVDHRPQLARAGSTPQLAPADSSQSDSLANTPSLGPTQSSSSIVEFMLDARVPSGEYTAAERAREEARDQRVRELMEETKLWRAANSAQWVAWGIVQAKVPGLEAVDGENHEADEDMEADEFDYLSYAQDRAMFFWGDCVRLGLVKAEELPEMLRANLKIVEH
ncbi:hypothetical protein NLU13_2364 [Sarocladium strictum]|uniref:Choline kinase N-terminal domain-containing protein n=1 Tax=Sarocladium strictum TaxID=5046 RepID=A0AA39LD77_SARSR|nr:hypothetical protein NLU13_2364 [Sarocladium strictum]